jgi:hypothetical protein
LICLLGKPWRSIKKAFRQQRISTIQHLMISCRGFQCSP